MKKKGFCFQRAVALLLAAVMIVTAAPQTSLTALAAEQGTTVGDPDGSKDIDILTAEDGADTDGDESADVPSDDGAGVGNDEQTGDPDNADQPDNAGDHTDDPDGINQGDDAGNSDETADPEEGMDDESVSGNDLEGGMSVFGDGLDEEEDEGPVYKGETRDDEKTDDGISYRRLIINGNEAQRNNVEITEILTYYAQQIESGKCAEFNCVELQMGDSFSMKKDYINGARSVMDTANEEIGCWIDYNFWNEADKASVTYWLSQPQEVAGDIDATCTVELIPHQGVKINVKTTEFPAESVGVSYNKEQQDAFAECWDGVNEEDLRLLAWDNGVASSVIELEGMWYDEYDFEEDGASKKGSNFGMSIENLQAGQDYLITPLFYDEDVAKGKTKELTAGQRSSGSSGEVSEVAWKSLNEELITIKSGDGAAATLTAADEMGEAYYYVTYTRDGKKWFELHWIRVAYVASDGTLKYIGEVIQNYFEDGDLAGTPYLRLRIDEAAAVEENKDKDITPILEFYKGKGLKVNCVEFNMMDTSPNTRVVKSDYINNALSVMNTENDDYWIDYNFHNDSTDEWRNFTLNQPRSCNGNISANVTMTPVAGLGVKLKFPAVNFPAEHVYVNIGGDNMADSIAASLSGAGEENKGWEFISKYSMFTMASGKPAAYVREGDVWYNPKGVGDSEGKNIDVNNINALKANTEYLMAPVKDDESMSAGGTKTLKPPTTTNVTWKSYTPDIVSIDANGNLSAWDEGEALYGVTYQEGNVWKANFYRMKVGRELSSMGFLEDSIMMEPKEQKYLNLTFYPSDAGCNQEDFNEIEWTIIDEKPLSGSGPVVKFGYYNDEGEEVDESGKGRGEIIAKNPGTATVKATYVPSKDTENPITAECKITVEGRLDWKEVESEVENIKCYAVSGCDTKLGDVKFPKDLPSEWKWKDPDLSLAPYAGSEGHDFAAICTKDGVSGEFTIWVRMVNATGIVMTSLQPVPEDEEEPPQEEPEPAADQEPEQKLDWVPWIPDSMEKDEKLSLGFRFELENCNGENGKEEETVQNKLLEKYAVEWSTNPKNLGTTNGSTYEYTAPILNKPEKKTFTVSLKDKTTRKVVYKASHTLTVTTQPLWDMDLIDENLEEGRDAGELRSLTFTVNRPKEDYDNQKLTFASMDNTILQLKTKDITTTESKTKAENGEEIKTTLVNIPCTQKNTGRVWIKVTAPDEMKSERLFVVELPDIQPKIVGAVTQTINKASKTLTVPIYMSTHAQYPLVKNEGGSLVAIQEVKSKGKEIDSGAFQLTDIQELSGEETTAILSENGENESDPPIGVYEMNLHLQDTTLKTGDYTVTLKCTVKGRKVESEPEEQTVNLTVKVTDVKPKVTFKQTKKVNLFYEDDEGAGTLQINTGEKITKVALNNYVDKNPAKNKDCHYAVIPKQVDGETIYKIVRKKGNDEKPISGFDGSLKKGTLQYEVEGYTGTFQTTFTVATENKAPSIVLSTKSDTLYPYADYWDSWISMKDKATGEEFIPNEAKWYAGKGANRKEEKLTIDEFDDNNATVQESKEKAITGNASKNTYRLFVTNSGNIVSRLQGAESYGKKADTINLELKKDNWSKPVAVSYKLQVNTATPKLTLGKATLTLNRNEAVYRGQQGRTTLRLNGFNDLIREDDWVSITGQDEKSKAELKGKDSSLVIQDWREDGDVIVRFNDNDIATGTYKFKISAGNSDDVEYTSTVLTVKIVDKTVKQSLKVTAKGSIDMLNREGTFITYTPKISNLTGTVVDGGLAGKDADLFEPYFEDGKLIVKAQEGRRYSTKIAYEVHTVFWVQTEDWNGYEISSDNDPKAKPFKIKVKQGKPKLKATTNGNTIYRQLDNRVDIRIEAMLGKQEVEIEDVWLLNYGDDLELEETTIKVVEEDEEGKPKERDENVIYNPETKSVRVALRNSWESRDITKNGTYKVKFAVRYRDKACDVKEAQVTCSIVVR